jgi:tetratricopeptide (TPR) repeat protein
MDLAPGIESLPLEERVQRVQRAWQSPTPRLLVFDNCEEEGLLEAWRPPSGGCRVLVTSRRSHWSPTLGVTALALDLLPRPDSIELLRRYRPDIALNDPGLEAIADELGDLPLAVHLAGSYLSAYRAEVSLDEYLAELRRTNVVQHASLLGAGLDDSPSPTRHVQSVAQTFALCLRRLDREREVDRVAIALLARMACMAPGEPVLLDLLARTLEDVDPLLRVDGLRRLGAVGLVEEGEGWLRLHRLLAHFVLQEALDPDARHAVDQALIAIGRAAEAGHLAGAPLAAVMPHLLHAVTAAGDGADGVAPAEVCDAAARALRRAGDYRPARPLFERALAIRERVLGSDHPATAISLDNLASLLEDQGEFAACTPLYERALAIRERALGPDHPDTAESLNDLAGPLLHRGECARARALFERSLRIRERSLGPEHPNTAQSLNNLALALRRQGDLVAATGLFERALAIWELALGPDHPDTALCLNNLALVHWDRGDLGAARRLFERALAVHVRVLGRDHPHTSHPLRGLAGVLRDMGDPVAARTLYERALAICDSTLECDHPNTARIAHELGELLDGGREPAAARPLFERALAIRERVLGPDHPDTVATRRALAEQAAEGGGPAIGL